MTRPMSEAVEAARRIVAWDDAGKLADDEWLVERNESAIIAIARALLSTSASERGMREALEFYAEDRRYDGPNQNNPGNDPHTPQDAPYLTDVTRDGGKRARAALSPKGEGK